MSPKVAVVIPTRGKAAFVRQCLKSLFLAVDDEATLDVAVIEQGGEESKALIEKDYHDRPVRWIDADDDAGYSGLNNAGVEGTESDYVLLLNNDIICHDGFLKQMISAMNEHDDVGIVGAKLMFLDGRIQHVGVVFRSDGVPYHIGYGKKDDGTFGPANRSNYYDSVTFACVLIRRALWDELGGLDEAYYFNYEDVDFCLHAREKGWRAWMQHTAVLVHLEGQSGENRKTEKHSLWRNLKILRDKWIFNGKLDELCGIKVNQNAGTLREDRLNIGFVPSSKGSGVPWWRIELPARKLAKLGLANIQMFYAGEQSDERMLAEFYKSDVLVVQGFWSDWVKTIAEMGAARPFGLVYDYDDHPLHISPFAQAYKVFGTREIELQNRHTGKKFWLWRDGEAGFDIDRNIDARAQQLEIMHLVDMLTTTTKPLTDYFRTLNPSTSLLPNCIDFDVFQHQYTLWQRTPGPVRIGWHGGDNHFHDVDEVGQELVKFVNANDVKLVLFGAFYRGALLGIDESKVEERGWTHVEAFPTTLATLGIDMAFIPLADPAKPLMGFNDYKSAIKFYEYAALRIPTVLPAGRRAYPDDECIHGVNCLRYSTPSEMTDHLARLVADAKLRERLGTAALDWVRENRDLEKNAPRWLEAYKTIARAEGVTDVADEELREPSSSAVAEGSAA
jgi:GT2 family glycosyltransferase